MAAEASRWWFRTMTSEQRPTKQLLKQAEGLVTGLRVRAVEIAVRSPRELTATALVFSHTVAKQFYETTFQLDTSTRPPTLASCACACKGGKQ